MKTIPLNVFIRIMFMRFCDLMRDRTATLNLSGDKVPPTVTETENGLTVVLGGTTYLVSTVFKPDGKNVVDKITRLIERDTALASGE